MRSSKLTLALLLVVAVSALLSGQKPLFDIRLNQITNNALKSCYDVQIRSSSTSGFNLAGQNYRLFYDATDVTFNQSESFSLLPTTKYTPMVVKQHIQNQNATGFADLSFVANISFLNYYMDLDDYVKGGIAVPGYDNGWLSTTRLCFDHVNPDVETDGFDAVWGRPEKTAGLATAFVEVSNWKKKNSLGACERYLMFDEMDINAATTFDLRLQASSSSNTSSCYDIQVKTNTLDPWSLAGQNYRLFFDASQVQYRPDLSTSALPSQYTSYVTVSYSNGVDATGYGSLPFESTLGFINSYIDLDDLSVGGEEVPNDQTWLTTANVCFDHIGADLLNGSKKGFAAVWGREGLTETYAVAFNEMSEWYDEETTATVFGYNYYDNKQKPVTGIDPRSADPEETVAINVFPNPTSDKLFVDLNLKSSKDVKIKLTNASGKEVYTKTYNDLEQGKNQINLGVENYPSGMYNLSINHDEMDETKAVIITHTDIFD